MGMIREIEVSTTIQPYEDLNLVVDSVRSFFPDWDPDLPSRDDGFPSNNSHEIIHGFSSSFQSVGINNKYSGTIKKNSNISSYWSSSFSRHAATLKYL